MGQNEPARVRRTQAERTAETRAALVEAAIRVIHRVGYGAASTALIADEAGITRGAILHHFGTRAELMAEVVRRVFEAEVNSYDAIMRELRIGKRVSDWVELCWRVMSRPSGMAVLDILLASRSDPELAALIEPMQKQVEEDALKGLIERFPANEQTALTRMRMIVWAIRGLTMGQMFLGDPHQMERAAALLREWFRAAEDAGAAVAGPDPKS